MAMRKNSLCDKLNICTKGSSLDLDVAFGYLDRSYTTFNYTSGKSENIDGYTIMLNPEDLDGKTMKELELISGQLNKLFDVTLDLDGIIKTGKAKISPKFGIGGFNIDLEVHS